MKRFFLFLTISLFVFPALSRAQGVTNITQELKVSSPQETMFTYIYAVKRYAQQPEMWAVVDQTLDAAPQMSDLAIETAAVQLYGILNRLGRVDPKDLPNQVESEAIDRFVFFPNPELHTQELNRLAENYVIELSRMGGDEWKFSRRTVEGIERLHDRFADEPIRYGTAEILISPSLWVRSKIPLGWKEQSFATLAVWQWLGLFVLIIFGMIVDFTFRLFLRTGIRRRVKKSGGAASPETVRGFLKPFGLLLGAFAVLLLLPLLGLYQPHSAMANDIIRGATLFLVVVSAAWSVLRISDLVAEVMLSRASRTESKLDDVLIPLLRRAVKVFAVVFGTIYAAESINLPIKPLLASLGIGGLAFAFAAKDTIENLFGSIAVILDRPFHVGDWVVIGDTEGTVEEIGFRSTRVRTFYNSMVTIPNSSLVRAEVDNYGRRQYRRLKCHLGLEYRTPPDKIVSFTEGIRELVRTHPYTRKDYFQVYFNQFGPSSLDILLYVFHETPDWSTELRERERLLLDILRLADHLGVNFAFPTQTLHLFQEDHHAEHQPGVLPGLETDSSAATTGRDAAQAIIHEQPWRDQKPSPVG